ncbi:MAG: T9SS type A sorting domain-containing protein [Bacteroidetes bacterium]|nr:T9SS type A sorting domain-containing protein [Bacteroidota bacterium]
MCNTNVGQVCVAAYDTAGLPLSTACLSIQWGGGGSGWEAIQTPVTPCNCAPFVIGVGPIAGICPGTCGNGMPSPNMYFAVYDNVWGSGVYQGPADNATVYSTPFGTGIYSWYVYPIDTSLGLANAILISGGSCGAPVNNIVTVFGCMPTIYPVSITPSPVCVGDTFTAADLFSSGTFDGWFSDPQILILPTASFYSTQAVAVSGPGFFNIGFLSTDISGCPLSGTGIVEVQLCSPTPVANFIANTTSICPYACVNFTNNTSNGTSYHWRFPGAVPDTSSSLNPPTICYGSSGDYDVELIAENANGSDTLLLQNYIHVYTVASTNSHFQNDTAFINTGFVSYEWYFNNQLLQGVNSYYCPVPVSGDYSAIVTDANGCNQTVVFLGLVSSVSQNEIQSTINIFPNPASDILTIENLNKNNPVISIEIINQTRQKIRSHNGSSENRINLSVNNLANGIYTLKIQYRQRKHFQKGRYSKLNFRHINNKKALLSQRAFLLS